MVDGPLAASRCQNSNWSEPARVHHAARRNGGVAAGPRAAQATKKSRLGVLLYSTPEADPQMDEFALVCVIEVTSRDKIFPLHTTSPRAGPSGCLIWPSAVASESPDLILAIGGDVAPHVARATTTIPIVFYSSADPVQLGLAVSLARPGRNATGIILLQDDLASKRLELLKEAVPRVSHVAFLYNPDHPDNELREARRAARSLGVRLELVEMRGSDDVEKAFDTISGAGCDALYVVSSRHTDTQHASDRRFCLTEAHPVGRRLGRLGACRWAFLVWAKRQ